MLVAVLLAISLTATEPAPIELVVREFVDRPDGSAEVQLEASVPLLTLGEANISGLLRSTPELLWQCQFGDEQSLYCTTAEGQMVPPASRLELRIAPGALFAQSGETLSGWSTTVETSRAELEVAVLGADARGLPQLQLYSSRDLVESTLSQRVVLRQGNQEWVLPLQRPAGLLSEADTDQESGVEHYGLQSARQRWSVQWPADVQLGVLAQLIAKPGIRIDGGPQGTEHEQLLHQWLPPAQLQFTLGCVSDYGECWRESSQQLTVNARLDDASIAELPGLLPAGMTLLARQPRLLQRWAGDKAQLYVFAWPIRVSAPATVYRMSIPSHWRGALGQTPAQTELVYTSGKPAPRSRVVPSLQLLPLGGQAPQQLSWTNIPALELLQRSVGGAKDSDLRLRLLEQEDPLRSSVLDIGRASRRLRLRGGTEWGTQAALDAHDAVRIVSDDYRLGASTFGRAWADVGLHALQREGQLRVFVTDLYSGLPLNGVETELLQLELKEDALGLIVQAQGPTAGDGRTDLLGADPRRTQVLRATRKGRTTVLPLHWLTRLHRASEQGADWDEREPFFVWTERLIYRPGDTVNFKLFLRLPQPRVLAAPRADERALQVRLLEDRTDQQLTQLSLNLDEFGGADGSWRIPEAARDGYVMFDLGADGQGFSGYGEQGFRVASVDPAALDVHLELPEGAITPDQLPQVNLSARYYSGGPVVDVESRLEGLLDAPQDSPLAAQFAEYQFESDLDAADDPADRKVLEAQSGCSGLLDSDVSVAISQPLGRTDAQGASRAVLTLPPFNCAIGELKLTPVVQIAGQPTSYGTTQRRFYSRDPQRLGLKAPNWAEAGEPVNLDARVVRMSDSRAVPDLRIELSIEHKVGAAWQQEQRCILADPAAAALCKWQPQKSGAWRVVASAAGMPSVKRHVHVWGAEASKTRARLEGPALPVAAGSTVNYRLEQPYPQARVLLSVESDGLLHQEWHTVDAPQVSLPLRIDPDWAPCFHVGVLVVPVTKPGQPLQASMADAVLTCVETSRQPLVELVLQPLECGPANGPRDCRPIVPGTSDGLPRTRPGRWVRARVRSLSDRPLSLSLTAIDAAVLDLDPELRAQRDPLAGRFLRREAAGGAAQVYSLQAWGIAPKPEVTTDPPKPLRYEPEEQAGLPGDEEELQAEALERVIVTGSRIPASAAFNDSKPGKGRRPERHAGVAGLSLSERWRVVLRQQFAESTAWLPSERIEPGTTRDFDFQLPDNLTRWHVEVLAADATDQFELVQAEIEAGLPLEARLLAPGRVFAGDSAVLAAEMRNVDDHPRQVDAALELPGTPWSTTRRLSLAGQSSQRLVLPWQARQPGPFSLLARLEDPLTQDADAVLRSIQVESRWVPWTLRQTGLLLEPTTRIDLTRLLSAGTTAHMQLRLSRNPLFGLAGLFDQMRDYPHRCLEQRLSRALVAWHARALGGLAQTDVSWASAAVFAEPLENLARYRNGEDELVYFNPAFERSDPLLMGYALLVLTEIGLKLPEVVQNKAIEVLREQIDEVAGASELRTHPEQANSAAFALRALARVDAARPEDFQRVLEFPGLLSVWGSSQLLQALAGRVGYATQRDSVLQTLRNAGVPRGDRILLRADGEHSGWLESEIRDRCEVLAALVAADFGEDAHGQQSRWLYGIFDAYGSDLPSWDTQAMASCSGAAHAYAQRWLLNAEPMAIRVSADGRSVLDEPLAAARVLVVEQSLAPRQRPLLQIEGAAGLDATFDLAITQQRDLLTLPAAAQGLLIERRAEVWRGQRWLPVPGNIVRIGDWVRVRLVVQSPMAVGMVALTDVVPGGLRAIDKTLEGVSDAQVQRADEGSYWFFERQLSSTHARFYATELPPGRHEVIYYTQALHAGRYAWPGTRGELMYALQRYGRSAPTVLEIAEAAAAPQ